jgi:hypothetical protein
MSAEPALNPIDQLCPPAPTTAPVTVDGWMLTQFGWMPPPFLAAFTTMLDLLLDRIDLLLALGQVEPRIGEQEERWRTIERTAAELRAQWHSWRRMAANGSREGN